MKKILILTSLFFALLINIGGATAATSLFEFKDGFDLSKVSTSDSIVSLTDEKMLRIQTGHENNWPGVTLKAPDGKWDLSKCQYISFPVKNLDDKEAELFCRVDNPGADGVNHCITESVLVSAGESGVIKVPLYPSGIRLAKPVELIGMRTPPVGQSKIDTGNVVGLVIFVNRPKIDHDVAIGNITAGGDLKVINNKDFFPFIDQFGQYIHKEWPGKTHSLEELKAHGKAEKKDLVDNRPPTDRNKWGGWTGGPKLKATGFFRVEKYKDKWWFVDPDGRLFWSHGVNCVDNSTPTPITGRAEYFTLPKEEGAYADFYGEGSWAPVGYYKGKGKYKTYDYCRANLYQKYGTNWENVFADLAHKRIRSWGMNTIANWSDRRICLQRKTPYVCTIHHWGKELAGSEGYWGKFYDVFDESFRQGLQRSFEQVKGTAVGDAWCIGFFVDNELGWGDEVSLALAALTSPADQAAKKVFVDDLEAKYKNIDELNIVWGTKYTSWDGVLESTEAP
ncbi:MAG: hypothetical protein JW912_01890, partial [Sedimentisphaerales bacterium]|nr:hypothetical protein [Sedimentisphaerales bacterium]